MSIAMICRLAINALRQNKMRSALTTLGMMIGVAAVITMVALGAGAQAVIDAQIQSTGTNTIIAQAGNFTQGGVRLGQGNAATLTPADSEEIRTLPGVRYSTAVVTTRGQVISGNANWSTIVQGADVDLPAVRAWQLALGEFFTPLDVSTASKVVVLGSMVRDQLYGPGENPVGQILRIQNQPFTIVGVLVSKGETGTGQNQDDVVFAPYTTIMKKMLGIANIQQVQLSAATAGEVPLVIERIRALLRVRHRIQPGEPDDFTIRTMEELASVRKETTATMTALLASIACVSLLVGGIGIMNIMLVSVTERTREIGLRMAIGAKGRDVLLQFLVEALVLSLFGGIIGILLGVGVSRAVSQFQGWPTAVSTDAVTVAFGFAAAVGVFFGFYPARKAAALDPIDALRFE
jgi:putative ABC transport system permease protein